MMENHFIESGEATFFGSQPPSSFQRITSRNQQRITSLFSLKNCLAELLLDLAENQLWELCQTGPSASISLCFLGSPFSSSQQVMFLLVINIFFF